MMGYNFPNPSAWPSTSTSNVDVQYPTSGAAAASDPFYPTKYNQHLSGSDSYGSGQYSSAPGYPSSFGYGGLRPSHTQSASMTKSSSSSDNSAYGYQDHRGFSPSHHADAHHHALLNYSGGPMVAAMAAAYMNANAHHSNPISPTLSSGHAQLGSESPNSISLAYGSKQLQPLYPWMRTYADGGFGNKRTRQTYTRFQTLELEKEFYSNRYLTRRRRIEIAHTLGLTERQIKIWFQNRRMKYKKENKLTSLNQQADSPAGTAASSSGSSVNTIPKMEPK